MGHDDSRALRVRHQQPPVLVVIISKCKEVPPLTSQRRYTRIHAFARKPGKSTRQNPAAAEAAAEASAAPSSRSVHGPTSTADSPSLRRKSEYAAWLRQNSLPSAAGVAVNRASTVWASLLVFGGGRCPSPRLLPAAKADPEQANNQIATNAHLP